MKNIRNRIIAILVAFVAGFGMFSMVNAGTPDENKAAGEAFLAENAKKPNIITTASGLQYEVLTPGTGNSPTASSMVTVKYSGKTIDGNEFDASDRHGGSATFPLDRVIPGWTEGLQLMKEGGKNRLYIPSKLAYGENAPSRAIGANSTLIFEVELLKVK